ncbi:hypothetical protein ACTG1Y_21925 [Aeromonas veronii]
MSPFSRAWQGEAGHPVLLPKSLQGSWLRRRCSRSVRRWLQGHPHRMVPVDSPAILFDVDTPERYQALLGGILENEPLCVQWQSPRNNPLF